MLRKFRHELRTLRDAEPGTRFELGHERTRIDNHVLRLFMVGVGVALMFTAAVTFWLPGPNFVLVFAGLVLVGGQSETVARWMDRGEVLARRWHRDVWAPYPHKVAVRLLGAPTSSACCRNGCARPSTRASTR